MIEGSCLCGAVRFTVKDFSAGIFKCHCSKCRKAFGGPSSAAALCGESGFRWCSGEMGVREYRTGSGFLRRFCERCGSILPQYLPDYSSYWVPVGLLDSDPDLSLQAHIYVDSKASWEVLDDNTPRLAEGFD